jgi:hypothetical protein
MREGTGILQDRLRLSVTDKNEVAKNTRPFGAAENAEGWGVLEAFDLK